MNTRHLAAVPAPAASPDDREPRTCDDDQGGTVAVLEPRETPARRAETYARAADELAGSVEDTARAIERARGALTGTDPERERAAVREVLAGTLPHLAAIARVLGEVHVGLDELAHELAHGPGGAA